MVIAAISAVENAKATVITILIATEASSVLRGTPMSSSQAAMALGQKVRLFRRSCSFTVNIFFWSLSSFDLLLNFFSQLVAKQPPITAITIPTLITLFTAWHGKIYHSHKEKRLSLLGITKSLGKEEILMTATKYGPT